MPVISVFNTKIRSTPPMYAVSVHSSCKVRSTLRSTFVDMISHTPGVAQKHVIACQEQGDKWHFSRAVSVSRRAELATCFLSNKYYLLVNFNCVRVLWLSGHYFTKENRKKKGRQEVRITVEIHHRHRASSPIQGCIEIAA